MSDRLTIEAGWEGLASGPQEDRATFAAIGIRYNDVWLTAAEDAFVKRIRERVHLSGYRLAEWLAWNWWRLRWEPHRSSPDWAMAHRMPTIGGGYIWPNITIVSDGERIVLDAAPTEPRSAEPLHYIAQVRCVVRAAEYEAAVDDFIGQVREQLHEEGVPKSNLDDIWSDVLEERSTFEIARRRKLEALLGWDIDEAEETVVDRLLKDSDELGDHAVEELAADRTGQCLPPSSSEIRELAKSAGFETEPHNVARLKDRSYTALPINVAAWRRGVAAAMALREQEQLGAAPISNARLCELAGTGRAAVQPEQKSPLFSFALDEGLTKGAVVLRSRYETGRRFDLARLLGDRVAVASTGRLMPATRTYTYRQKLQRAFAGEFLCPFSALSDMLRGDFSPEAIEDAAAYFKVSDRAVRTLLANNGLIDRKEVYGDSYSAA